MEKQKLTKSILIGLTDETEQCAISISPDMDAATAFQLVGTLALHILNAFKEVATQDIKSNKLKSNKLKSAEQKAAIQGMTESLYDAMDNIFSNVLSQFYPQHARYELDDEAIIILTNQLIEDRYNAMSPEEKSQYAQAYKKMKLQAEYRKDHTKRGTDDSSTSEDTEPKE